MTRRNSPFTAANRRRTGPQRKTSSASSYDVLSTAGGTMAGTLTLAADPLNSLDAASKRYVDNVSQGLQAKNSVQTVADAALPAYTYAANALTATANGALPALGGCIPVAGDHVLVDQGPHTGEMWMLSAKTGSLDAAGSVISFTKMQFGNAYSADGTALRVRGRASRQHLALPLGALDRRLFRHARPRTRLIGFAENNESDIIMRLA